MSRRRRYAHRSRSRPHRALSSVAVVAGVVVGGAAGWTVTDAGTEDTHGAVAGPAPTTTTTSTTAPAPTAASAPADPLLGSGQPITIAFGGDSAFDGSNADLVTTDPGRILAGVAPALAGADLAVVNMETAIGVGGTMAGKQFAFQAPPAALEAFRAAGVDVVSAANNHGMDYGVESLHETLAAERDLGFPVIGIGADEREAYSPFVAEVRGQRIAIIAATQVLDGHLVDSWTATPGRPGMASAKRTDRLVQAITEIRPAVDTVVVFLHWGIERHTCPSEAQESLATELVAAGADVVVGGHAHRLQGGGQLGDAVVHYGLGNLAFGAHTPAAARTGVFVVTVTGQRVDGYQWLPGRIVDRRPTLLDGETAAAELAYWERLRDCTGLTP